MAQLITIRLPFNGDYPVTFPFGALPVRTEIKKKFSEWGIVGHNGIDYGLPEGTDVVAAAYGEIIQVGDIGDFGISVMIQHNWGTSLYAHLQETKVSVSQVVKVGKVIALSGRSGAAFGQHLHFGIKPINANLNNGYLGYVDPSPFIKVIKSRISRKGSTGGGREDKKSKSTKSSRLG